MPAAAEKLAEELAAMSATEALRVVEARRQEHLAMADATTDLRLRAMVRAQLEDNLTAAQIAEELGLPATPGKERETSAARVRQWLLEGRKLVGVKYDAQSGRPPTYGDKLQVNDVLQRLLDGATFAAIAAATDTAGPTVARFARKHNIIPAEITAARTATAASKMKRFANSSNPAHRAAVAMNPHLPDDLAARLENDDHPVVRSEAARAAAERGEPAA